MSRNSNPLLSDLYQNRIPHHFDFWFLPLFSAIERRVLFLDWFTRRNSSFKKVRNICYPRFLISNKFVFLIILIMSFSTLLVWY